MTKKEIRFGNQFDFDQNGFLNGEEIENWIFQNDQKEVASELIKDCDVDGNGKLSKTEIKINISKFAAQKEWIDLWQSVILPSDNQ